MGKRNTRNNKKLDENNREENDSSNEETVTPKRARIDKSRAGSSQRSKRSVATDKQKTSSCRRRLQDALDFARQSDEDDNNNAISSPETVLSLNPGQNSKFLSKDGANDIDLETLQTKSKGATSTPVGETSNTIAQDKANSKQNDSEYLKVMSDFKIPFKNTNLKLTVADPEDDDFDVSDEASCAGSSGEEDYERVVEINFE